jgi:hypothetical protein
VAVVGLDDFNVVAGGHGLGGHLQQLEGDVDADAHVGRHHDGNVGGCSGDLGLLCVAETGGADHQAHAQFAAHPQMGQRAFGPGEVDQHLRVFQTRVQVCRDSHAAGMTQEGAGVLADGRAGRHVQRTGQRAVGRGVDGFDEHVAHAARGAGHGDSVLALAGHGDSVLCFAHRGHLSAQALQAEGR